MPRGRQPISDEERKASGTFRPSRSDEARAKRLAENVYAGPGFRDVPDPALPLSDFELRVYFELCGRLLREGKLTRTTRDVAEQIALLKGAQHQRMECGQKVPAYISRDIMRCLAMLKLAEDTKPIGGNVGATPKENPFDVCGALVRPFAAGRLRQPSAAPA